MTLINAHIIDERGVYVRTEQVDPMGPQPRGAIYDGAGDTLPDAKDGFTRMRIGNNWVQVPDAEVPIIPAPVPTSCTRRQGLLALLSYGIKRADIEASIEAIEDEIEREAAWIEYLANDWELGNPTLQTLWLALGGTSEQLPDLFRLAVTL